MLLEHNTRNPRKVSRSVVRQYATDMRSGNWRVNGETIVIDRDGNMKNGQHRCLACIESGCAFETLLVYGVEPGQSLYDMQYRRGLAQEMGVPKDWEYITSVIVTDAYRNNLIPKGLAEKYIRDHEKELDRAAGVCRFGGNVSPRGRRRDVMAAVYLMLRNGADEDGMKAFFSVVNSGFPLDGVECSTAIVFSKYVDAFKNTQKTRTMVIQRIETFIRAWSDYLAGTRRRVAYKIMNTDKAEKLLRAIRLEDGLE